MKRKFLEILIGLLDGDDKEVGLPVLGRKGKGIPVYVIGELSGYVARPA